MILLLLLAALLSSSARSEPQFLSIGEKLQFPLPKNKKIYIGQKNLFTLREQGSVLSLSAKKQGSTLLSVGQKTYQIFVLTKEEKQNIKKVSEFIKSIWGLNWSFVNNKIKIDGDLNRVSDWIDLSQLSKQYQIDYIFKARPSVGLGDSLNLFFKQQFKHKTPPRMEWSELPNVFIPEGSDIDFYKKELKFFGLTPQIDSNWKTPAPFIKINIALIEIAKTLSSALGGSLISPSKFSFLDFLNLLKGKAKGKIINQSSLVTQNKQKVTFHSGGHIPFLQNNLETKQQTLNWKSYGLNITLTPQIYSFKTLKLQIKWNHSEPASISSSNKMPPLKNQKWDTTLQIKSGQILKLFYQHKKARGNVSEKGFSMLIPKNLNISQNQYEKSQYLFIQPTILDSQTHKKNILELEGLIK